MPSKTQDVKALLNVIKKRFGHDLEIDRTAGQGLRIVSHNGSRDESFRGSTKEIYRWLQGYYQALENVSDKRFGRFKA